MVAASIPVCVFAKPPVAGEVKTRLAVTLGRERAAGLAAAMLRDVWRTVCSTPGVRPILATVRVVDFPIALAPEDIWMQGDGDLGARIERILRRGLETAPAAVALGADSPLLTQAHLQGALAALEHRDAVMGRCRDGGFHVLGLRRCPAGLLQDLPWSTSETAEAIRARLEEHAFCVGELPELFDVDRPDDFELLTAELRHNPALAPATYAWYLASQHP